MVPSVGIVEIVIQHDYMAGGKVLTCGHDEMNVPATCSRGPDT